MARLSSTPSTSPSKASATTIVAQQQQNATNATI